MRFFKLHIIALLFFVGWSNLAEAQVQDIPMEDIEISPYDFGKMWTFENLPVDYFEQTYGFRPTEEWTKKARMSALRFASWCSASFVSPDGLIMTNHHCSRDVVTPLQQNGENFDTQGFVANTRKEERKAADLFVEQLVQVADITSFVKSKTASASNNADRLKLRQEAFQAVQEEYSSKPGWEGLRLQTVTFYSGGKFSLYGYKKYSDIRLVMIPELDLGFYGGDPDNFTYPRYNLDCTFWRAYDENGKPLDTSDNYFKFKEAGAAEGEAVFVIGNPGSTERYRTVAQLEYDRDYRYPVQMNQLTKLKDHFQAMHDKNPNQDLMNTIFGISNSMKAINGTIEGLHNPVLFGRKKKMEQKIKAGNPGLTYWDDLEKSYKELGRLLPALQMLGYNPNRPSPIAPNKTLAMLYKLNEYETALTGGASKDDLKPMQESIKEMAKDLDTPDERAKLIDLLSDYDKFSPVKLMGGANPTTYVNKLFDGSKFFSKKKLKKMMKGKSKKFLKDNDPFLKLARNTVPRNQKALEAFQSTGAARRAMEANVANAVFNVYGSNLPPDATFTLRMADGVVKGYDYNGTVAPYKTTYFGMYDRHYSNNGKFPWSLPDRWLDPPVELMKAPINFVSTNDIIGGNSGSPMINKDLEAVGLIFDGNIESLPGKFIFDDEFNRTVSVHAGGIAAAIKYIYKADNLYKELTGK